MCVYLCIHIHTGLGPFGLAIAWVSRVSEVDSTLPCPCFPVVCPHSILQLFCEFVSSPDRGCYPRALHLNHVFSPTLFKVSGPGLLPSCAAICQPCDYDQIETMAFPPPGKVYPSSTADSNPVSRWFCHTSTHVWRHQHADALHQALTCVPLRSRV